MSISINNLSSKFQSFLIGSPNCPAKIKDEIDALFRKHLTPIKSSNIIDAGKWVLKSERADGSMTTPDTHLYRVRKAEKIRAYIHQNKLEDHLAVPRKYLYWNAKERRFYVVAEKMKLSPEVATPATYESELNFKDGACHGGQTRALVDGAPMRSLTPVQAKALAELSILGYTDLSYNNLYFTPEGKVAIVDTEPQKRALNKTTKSVFFFLFCDKKALLTQQSLAGIAKLKLYTDDPAALKAVQKVERNHVLWQMARLITKISVVTLAIYFIPTLAALVPITGVATTLKVSLVLKDLFLIMNTFAVYSMWSDSCKGLAGVVLITKAERLGVL